MGKIWTIPQPAMIAREEHLPPHIKNLFSMIKTDELVVWRYGKEKSLIQLKVSK